MKPGVGPLNKASEVGLEFRLWILFAGVLAVVLSFGLGASIRLSLTSGLLVILQLFIGKSIVSRLSRGSWGPGYEVVAAVVLGTGLFAFLSATFDQTWGFFTLILGLSLVLWLTNNRSASREPSRSHRELSSDSFELMALVVTGVFFFLAQRDIRFLVYGFVLAFAACIALLRRPNSKLRQKFNQLYFGLVGLCSIHLIITRPTFTLGIESFRFHQDSVVQAAMAQSFSKFGMFDSALLSGTSDRYHWLSWAWAGGFGRFDPSNIWQPTEVVTPVLAAVLFSVALVSLLRVTTNDVRAQIAVLAAVLLSDSALENSPTIEFGGTSGFVGLIWVLGLFVVIHATFKARYASAVVFAVLTIVFSLLGKATYGLVVAGVLFSFFAIIGVRQRRVKQLAINTLATIVSSSITYLFFLRPAEAGSEVFRFSSNLTVLDYSYPDLIDLLGRFLIVLALLYVGSRSRHQKPVVPIVAGLALATSLFLLVGFSFRGSGSVSLVWIASLFAGLTVLRIDFSSLGRTDAVIVLVTSIVSVVSAVAVIWMQWLGQVDYQKQITLLLWASFVFSVIFPALVKVLQSRHQHHLGRAVLVAIVLGVCALNMGRFVAQASRVHVRQVADEHKGWVRNPPETVSIAEVHEMQIIGEWLRLNTAELTVVGTNIDTYGPMIALFGGRRSFAEGGHSAIGFPIEYARRTELLKKYGEAPSSLLAEKLLCEGVDYFVIDQRKQESTSIEHMVVNLTETYSVVDLRDDIDAEISCRASQ